MFFFSKKKSAEPNHTLEFRATLAIYLHRRNSHDRKAKNENKIYDIFSISCDI